MGRLKLQSNPSGTGDVIVTVPSTSGNFTITMPAETGTLLTTGTEDVTFSGEMTVGNITVDSSITLPDSSVPVSKLQVPGGTPSSSTFLRGDNQWAAPPAVDKASVLDATSDATFGAVGTYAFLMNATNSNLSDNGTRGGSGLRYNQSTGAAEGVQRSSLNDGGAASTYNGGGSAPSGTWRKMGSGTVYSVETGSQGENIYNWRPALYLRIS